MERVKEGRRRREGGGREEEEKGKKEKKWGSERRRKERKTETEMERKRKGSAVTARTPTSDMSVKGGGVSLYEMRGKEGNSPYTSVPTIVGGAASLLRRPWD